MAAEDPGTEREAVVIVGVMIYFVLVLAALGWWLLPGVRERLLLGLHQWRKTGTRTRRAWAGSAQRSGSDTLGRMAASTRGLAEMLRGHAGPVLAALALLVLVPAVTLALRHWSAVDTFDHTYSRGVNPQVAALLQGEQLVPPAPLPPALFITREVVQARPLAATANRQWELLDADFRQRLLGVFKLMHERHGIEMALIEGYRSPERQAELAGLGPNVTHAGAGQSWHQYGMAADCAFLIDGRIVISEADPRAARGYELYGEVAQSFGLTWGGRWRNLRDLGHVELHRAGVMARP
jgi:peptidoglycan LD-endopeptidase CwlK